MTSSYWEIAAAAQKANQLRTAFSSMLKVGSHAVLVNFLTNRIIINPQSALPITRTMDDYTDFEEGNLETFVYATLAKVAQGLEAPDLKYKEQECQI